MLVLQAVATPFGVGVLLLEPDGMFYMLLVYYFFGKTKSCLPYSISSKDIPFLFPRIKTAAESWFATLFTVIVEIVPPTVRAVVLGIFLFGMNNIGGNLPVVVDPVAEKFDYRTALLIFFPGFIGASESSRCRDREMIALSFLASLIYSYAQTR